nr:adenylate/guanylate cyclase domain-containing protein [Leptospiraceae bacterium]
ILSEYFIINHSGKVSPWIAFSPENARKLNILNEAVVFAVIILEGVYFYKSLLLAEEKAETEQKKSDSLLLNILPEDIASELKRNGRTVPRHIPNAVIVFTDFAGFTVLSEKMSAEDLILELDFCFSEFDVIIKKYNLEKLKTIGDAYMFAGGLLHSGTDFSFRCVSASLEIRDFILNRKREMSVKGQPYWDIRIGIHKGPVAAGVIGRSKFSFDVWGDTVNTASRLESSGVPGKVNISESVKTDVSGQFNLEYRGEIHAKSKGALPMYFAEPAKKNSLQTVQQGLR